MVAKGKVVDVTIERKKDQANTYESILKLIQDNLDVDHKLTKRSEKSSVIGFTIRPKVTKTRDDETE
ncbi:hypothetical protein RUM44_006860 [Polyplax serrata]|uniref:Uncharacterized protein n=1 Tax=Polyplax serrata TaxID=468196 RepID=A0ABR1AJ84_POLSC